MKSMPIIKRIKKLFHYNLKIDNEITMEPTKKLSTIWNAKIK